MSETASATELTSHYTAQVTGDLDRNTKEQERIGDEIAALQEQLSALQRDATILVNIQRAIGTAPAPAAAEPQAPAEGSVVPAPRKKQAATPTTGKRTRTKKATAAPAPAPAATEKPAAAKRASKSTAKPAAKPSAKSSPKASVKSSSKASAKPAAKASATKSPQPTLVDLVRQHLTEQSEPRSAAEVATTLGQTHPERNVKVTVVRTTLEGLVAKSLAQRSKQGSSVFYTSPDATQETAPQQADEQPAAANA
ncbi:hypothetical protein ACIO93_03350 [Streptomyces sp. NPDC087903]|uniref:hypothetical protein n=1 Tax=Streptomyces sp. NPDC087903 TaxID=3365819 RepID=UPI00380BE518